MSTRAGEEAKGWDMALKDKDKDRVAGSWEIREKRQGVALSSHPTGRLRCWGVTLMEGGPGTSTSLLPPPPAKDLTALR